MAFLLHLISITAISIPTILAYSFVFGRGKILHFGPIGVGVVSAYGSFVTLSATNNFFLALGMGILMATVCSLLFAWLSFRLDPDGLGILSIAMHLMLVTIILNWQSLTRGALGIPRIPRIPFMESPAAFAIGAAIICIAWIIFFFWLDRTPLARKLTALAEQEWHAKSLGIHRVRAHLIAFLILGLALASDSFFHAQYFHLLHPNDYQFPAFITLLMVVVAGKPGSMRGTLIAGVLLTFLEEALRFVPFPTSMVGPMRLLLFGVILLGAVWWRRDVLFPKPRTI